MSEPPYHLPGTPQRSLWDSLPCTSFVRLDELRSLDLTYTTVLFKTRPAIRGLPVQSETLIELPFGGLEALTCGTISVGYQITMPKCRVNVGPNFATFSLRDVPTAPAEKFLVNRDIAVFGNPQAVVAVSPRRYWTLSSDGT